eukprot:3674027-Prymnesium_polylepis.1
MHFCARGLGERQHRRLDVCERERQPVGRGLVARVLGGRRRGGGRPPEDEAGERGRLLPSDGGQHAVLDARELHEARVVERHDDVAHARVLRRPPRRLGDQLAEAKRPG